MNLAEVVPQHGIHRSNRSPHRNLWERVEARLHPPKADGKGKQPPTAARRKERAEFNQPDTRCVFELFYLPRLPRPRRSNGDGQCALTRHTEGKDQQTGCAKNGLRLTNGAAPETLNFRGGGLPPQLILVPISHRA